MSMNKTLLPLYDIKHFFSTIKWRISHFFLKVKWLIYKLDPPALVSYKNQPLCVLYRYVFVWNKRLCLDLTYPWKSIHRENIFLLLCNELAVFFISRVHRVFICEGYLQCFLQNCNLRNVSKYNVLYLFCFSVHWRYQSPVYNPL